VSPAGGPTMTELHAVTEAARLLPECLTTRAYADREVFTVSPHEPIGIAAALMAASGVRHLCLVEDGRLVGVISDRDTRGLAGPDGQGLHAGSPVGDLVWRIAKRKLRPRA
jgi:CBS domain-containing protein